jgi:hypothetical protein
MLREITIHRASLKVGETVTGFYAPKGTQPPCRWDRVHGRNLMTGQEFWGEITTVRDDRRSYDVHVQKVTPSEV